MYRACTLTPWNFQLEVANATTRRAQRVGKEGSLAGDFHRIDAGLLPPCALVASAMYRPVVCPAKRNRELVAGLAAQRPWLDESK